jgi:hypothetical protein
VVPVGLDVVAALRQARHGIWFGFGVLAELLEDAAASLELRSNSRCAEFDRQGLAILDGLGSKLAH